jgi:DNA-directed RNA polymerase subunit K/omega
MAARHTMANYVTSRRGKYIIVNALARRIRALQNGSKPYVHRTGGDPRLTALDEMFSERILVYHTAEEAMETDGVLEPPKIFDDAKQ